MGPFFCCAHRRAAHSYHASRIKLSFSLAPIKRACLCKSASSATGRLRAWFALRDGQPRVCVCVCRLMEAEQAKRRATLSALNQESMSAASGCALEKQAPSGRFRWRLARFCRRLAQGSESSEGSESSASSASCAGSAGVARARKVNGERACRCCVRHK